MDDLIETTADIVRRAWWAGHSYAERSHALVRVEPINLTEYSESEARSLLSLLSECGVVRLAEDQSLDVTSIATTGSSEPIPLRTMRVAIEAGFRRTRPLLEAKKELE